MLAANAVTVRARTQVLLREVSLAVAAGEAVALVGPNGAGKSTLLRVISGERAPDAGTVTLNGRAVRDFPSADLALRRAVLSQSIQIAFPFTVLEIVRMGAGERRGRAVEALVDAALAEVDLDHCRERVITTLSGGEQQRAHFARVLVQLACGEGEHGPGLLLLDEPTASLDLRHQLDIAQAARRRAACGTAVIAVLHDLNLAVRFASRVVVLAAGELVRDGPAERVVTEDTLGRFFAVADAVGRVPGPSAPFVLPHQASSMAGAALPPYSHFRSN
jgi:iron complex transport system ATP-binding protein